MTEHPARDTSIAAVAAVLAARRTDLVRFFAFRLGSAQAGEALVDQIGSSLAEGDFRHSGGDALASLFRLGSQILADQRRAQRPNHVGLRPARAGGSASPPLEEQDKRAQAMVEQLLSLPADALLVLRLRKLEGFSFLTIAEMLDIPVDEVEGHLRAALHQLLSLAPRAVASDGA